MKKSLQQIVEEQIADSFLKLDKSLIQDEKEYYAIPTSTEDLKNQKNQLLEYIGSLKNKIYPKNNHQLIQQIQSIQNKVKDILKKYPQIFRSNDTLDSTSTISTYISDLSEESEQNTPLKISKQSKNIKKRERKQKQRKIKPYMGVVEEIIKRRDILSVDDFREVLINGISLEHLIEMYEFNNDRTLLYSKLQEQVSRKFKGTCKYLKPVEKEEQDIIFLLFVEITEQNNGKMQFKVDLSKVLNFVQEANLYFTVPRRSSCRTIAKEYGFEFYTSQQQHLYLSYPQNQNYENIINIQVDQQGKPFLELKRKQQLN